MAAQQILLARTGRRPALFILGFLILTGLFEVATGGEYAGTAQMAALIGYLVWRVAGGCMADVTRSVETDAQWGTLEQVWLSGAELGRCCWRVVYRSFLLLIAGTGAGHHHWPCFAAALDFYGCRLTWRNAALQPDTHQPIGSRFSAVWAAFGLQERQCYHPASGHYPALLNGALTPLDGIPVLYALSRVLPLSIGIDLLRDLLVEGTSLHDILASGPFVALLINSALYLGAGLLVLLWARQKVLSDGSLAHY